MGAIEFERLAAVGYHPQKIGGGQADHAYFPNRNN